MNVTDRGFELERAVLSRQGFAVYVLANHRVEVAVVPELGAKIISLKNVQTGREWMWHPPGGLKLFRNNPGDAFSDSPLVGVDECLPTIVPCMWQGRKLPDHGEAWAASWDVDPEAWETGQLRASTRLAISPFEFERTIELQENEVQLNYRLDNRSPVAEPFLWAMHPLLNLRAGDRLVLPASTRALLNGETWIDALDSAVPAERCSKLFAAPLVDGFTAVENRETGERFEFQWNPAENNTVGLWLTRGGWHGHHHFAIEPTNADTDELPVAAARKHCGMLPAAGSVTWQVSFRIGP